MVTIFEFSGLDETGRGCWPFDHWRDGETVARIIWTDGQGAEHEAVIFNEHEALDLLDSIRRDPSLRKRRNKGLTIAVARQRLVRAT